MFHIIASKWKKWDQFWFAPQDPIVPAMIRCGLAVMMLFFYSLRIEAIPFFYYGNGFVPYELAPELMHSFYHPFVFWYPQADWLVAWMYGLFILCLLMLVLGIFGRWLTWLTLFLHLAFMQRNFSLLYGADIIAAFWLFYLGFTQHNLRLNVWNYLRGRSQVQGQLTDPWTGMGLRLMQVQLCIIYAYTGLEKLKGMTWWEGTAVWNVMGNAHLTPIDLSFFSQWPLVVAAMTYTTLVFEIYFPIAVWVRTLSKYWLLLGVFFHVGIAFFIGLYFFSGIMLIAYLTFVEPKYLHSLLSRQWLRQP